jgi:hypothetical protein
MAVLPVNDDALPDVATLSAAISALAPAAPVVILIHGFRFDPHDPRHSPHSHILAQRPDRACWKAVSWPRHLGLTGDRGLAIGFGWRARGTIWQAHARAPQAGARLARLIGSIRAADPARPIHVFAHSLGARVLLTALPRLPAGAVDRAIFIAAAAFRAEARRVMKSPAARAAEIVNVLSPENTLFDLLLRAALPLRGATLGRGLRGPSNWLDLPLGGSATLARLDDIGHRIRPARVNICHWSGYLRPGVFGLYRALLLRPAEMPLAVLRNHLAPPARPGFLDRLRNLPALLPPGLRRRAGH